MDAKPFYQSKTLWANVILLALDVVNGTYGLVPIPDLYKPYIVIGVNVALRFLTGAPLTVGK